MHSDIQLISTPGIGSKFFFDICLPIQKKTQKLLGHNSSSNTRAQRASKLSNSILIVEDNLVEQSSLYQILNLNGLQVLHSRSAFDALGLLKIESVNLVITDLSNPLINSTQLLQKIQQHYPRLRVIATIDYSLKNNIQHYEHLGFDNVMIKPFSQDYVLSIIAQYFDLEISKNPITKLLDHSERKSTTGFELPTEFSALIIEQCDLYLVKEVEVLIDRLMEKFPDNDDYFLQLQNFVNNYDLEGLTSFLKGDADVR
jgi:CheY-like chemotaxis protein